MTTMNTLKSRWKTALGLALIIAAVLALCFWEAEGRELFLMEGVLVAKEPIKAGVAIEPGMFRTVRVPEGALVEHAVRPEDAESVRGLLADGPIYKGAQLTRDQLKSGEETVAPETSCFVIRNEWIYMCSSSLRRGDSVQLRSRDGRTDFGIFPVAYVKDSEGREVTDAAPTMRSFTDPDEGRANASSPIHHIEIRSEWKPYKAIMDYCNHHVEGVLLVRKEGV